MKKIIYLLLLLLIPVKVLALEQLEEDNRKYRFYYIEKEYSEKFYEKGKNEKEFPKMGTTWYYEDKMNVSKKKPSKEKLIVEEIKIIKYQEHKKVQYVIIDQFTSSAKVNLMEIEVFSKQEKIPYAVSCDTCSETTLEKFQNDKVDYEYNYIENNAKIILDLKEGYFPNDLTIKIHIGGSTNKTAQFRITVNNTKELDDTYIKWDVSTVLAPYIQVSKNLKEIEHEERLEEKIQEARGIEDIENAKVLEQFTEYHYRNKLYQYYKETKHYIDGYYKDLPGLIKDETDYIKGEENSQNPSINSSVDNTIKEKEPKETIIDFIEKEVPVKVTEVKEAPVFVTKEIPIVTEKLKEKDKIVEVPIEKIVEKNRTTKSPKNYPLQYIIYSLSAIFLKKMSFFGE